ncbi:MAG: hypothetical protein WD733_19515 [Bryobacterales bacterium]
MKARRRFSLTAARTALLLCLAAAMAFAQQRDNRDPELDCSERWDSDKVWFCEMRELTVPASGARIVVDEVRNGGVSVKGWSRDEIWVRASVRARANSESEARELAKQVRIETSGMRIRGEGPERNDDRQWSVGFEIFVPHRSDLLLGTRNGGIHVADVRGDIQFETRNGGVSLERLGGDVSGHTRNGGVSVDLAGDHWDGGRLDVETRNGGVKMAIPENYSARVETETVNGPIKVEFPVTVQGQIGRRLSFQLGSGGGLVRAVTTNGGVVIRRKL